MYRGLTTLISSLAPLRWSPEPMIGLQQMCKPHLFFHSCALGADDFTEIVSDRDIPFHSAGVHYHMIRYSSFF